jgi:hypothetical protein
MPQFVEKGWELNFWRLRPDEISWNYFFAFGVFVGSLLSLFISSPQECRSGKFGKTVMLYLWSLGGPSRLHGINPAGASQSLDSKNLSSVLEGCFMPPDHLSPWNVKVFRIILDNSREGWL